MAKPKNINVDEMLSKTDHPLMDEVQLVRGIIKGVDPGIVEAWQWNAPSYSYSGHYLVTFNLWAKERIHLVFHNSHIVEIESPILEGEYPTRRMTYFADRADIEAKRAELERVLKELLRLTGGSS